jgi:hypothetical protein
VFTFDPLQQRRFFTARANIDTFYINVGRLFLIDKVYINPKKNFSIKVNIRVEEKKLIEKSLVTAYDETVRLIKPAESIRRALLRGSVSTNAYTR